MAIQGLGGETSWKVIQWYRYLMQYFEKQAAAQKNKVGRRKLIQLVSAMYVSRSRSFNPWWRYSWMLSTNYSSCDSWVACCSVAGHGVGAKVPSLLHVVLWELRALFEQDACSYQHKPGRQTQSIKIHKSGPNIICPSMSQTPTKECLHSDCTARNKLLHICEACDSLLIKLADAS